MTHAPGLRRARGSAGYTLVELLVVLVILGVMLGLVSLSIGTDPKARLLRDAERLESLFSLASDEAQLSARQIAWRGDDRGYAFFRRDGTTWTRLETDDVFRPRAWDAAPMRLTLAASDVSRFATRPRGAADLDGGTAIAFPRDGVQPPFSLSLEVDGATVTLFGDGIGRYRVEPGA